MSSEESEDDTTIMLRAQGVSNESIRKFKSGRKRIRGRKIVNNSCTKCAKVTLDTIRSGFVISASFNQLLSSSEACRLCRLVVMSLRNKLPEIDQKLGYHSPERSTSRVAVKFHEDGGTDVFGDGAFRVDTVSIESVLESFRLSMSNVPDGVIRVEAKISRGISSGDRAQPLCDIQSCIRIYTTDAEICRNALIPLDPRPKSTHKFDLMRRWLMVEMSWPERFLEPVTLSLGTDRSDSYPSRLVHIPLDFASPRSRLRLINSQDLVQYGYSVSQKSYPPYVTLSHRWGSVHHFTSTKANLESRYTGFSVEELPRTYRDAVSVTASLGFEYIWIDAICIVQNDSAEWLSEAQKMGTIYRHATCTIATHAAENDDSGFLEAAFERRGSTKLSSCHMTGMYLRGAADLEFDISKSALSKRGWILQERFLSTRILHFTTGMIYLETARGIKSEDGDTPMDLVQLNVTATELLTLDQFLHQKPVTLQTFSSCLPQSFRVVHGNSDPKTMRMSPLEWFSLLEMYSTCSLTNEQDKLTAISGIAQICRQTTTSPYVGGIWEDRLAIGLMWMNVGHPLVKSSHLRASSWSWAAYDGPIQFPLAGCPASYTANCYLVPRNSEFTAWCNGPFELTVRANILDLSEDLQLGDLSISLYRESLHPRKLASAQDDALWSANYPTVRLFDLYNVHRFLWTKDEKFHRDLSWVVFDCGDSLQGRRDYKMPLSCISMASFSVYNGYNAVMLLDMVVFVVPAGKPNTYKRVGAGVIRNTFMENLVLLRKNRHDALKLSDIQFVSREINLV